MTEEICNKVEHGEVLTLEDLKKISYMLLAKSIKNLQYVEQYLRDDVVRKRDLYSQKHGIDWRFHLDPQYELEEISEEQPIEERIRRLLTAEAGAEFSIRDQELEKRWEKHEINYDTFNKMSLESFNSVFGLVSKQ